MSRLAALLGRRPRPVPLSILTGFLGSGKTTVLNRLLGAPGMADSAVIINEFGEVGVDHLLVEQVDERMVTLSNGCVCCTARGDILATLRDLFGRRARREIPRFRRVLVETTGLADPTPIVSALVSSEAARRHVFLDTIAATVDGVHGARTLDAQPEAVKQAAVADLLLVTKADVADRATLDALAGRVRAHNPAAPLHEVAHGELGEVGLFGRGAFDPAKKSPDVRAWLAAEAVAAGEHPHRDHDVSRHGDISAFCLTRDEPIAFDAFRRFCDALVGFRGPDLLRMKGLVHVREAPNHPLVVHGVQHVMHPPRALKRWPPGARRTQLVFITRGISKDDLDCMLRGFERERGAAFAPDLDP